MSSDASYTVKRESQSLFVPIRGLQYHLRTWGESTQAQIPNSAIPLVMVHGWMDVSASFQFVVDAFKQDRYIVSPDWRGYGLTVVPGIDNYWFPDYMADLDFVLDHLEASTGHKQFDLVGHSMGGNVAMVYTGVRPERIRRLINLEGFGMPKTRVENATKRYAQWMNELKDFHAGKLDLASYESQDGVAKRLMKNNPRLSADKAQWLSGHWGAPIDTAQ